MSKFVLLSLVKGDVKKGEENTILTPCNRELTGRNNPNPATHGFVASTTALTFAGKPTFKPLTDTLTGDDGKPFKSRLLLLRTPPCGYDSGESTFQPRSKISPASTSPSTPRAIVCSFSSPSNHRLADRPTDLPILIKVKQLKYHGRLKNISQRCSIVAINIENNEGNKVKSKITSNYDKTQPNNKVDTVGLDVDTFASGRNLTLVAQA
ncbi:hypothetical protein EST38_g11540 [Candolleomyces aberdarensis]|uniref:Uncharacterized protein n=1 Tax=Candolleomyces aberdarensis TaxID=2316362 RepID=A0A4Q2D7B4_9AGAR|nr:hypothetical protein EST38_g11540 [Candolleomyces aberdarensis]